ncbi:MAG: flagellar hook capping FlgD N-terminal domain-containing protein [Terracidiphilus sp.]
MATSSLISTQHAAASISLARSHPAASSTASTGSSASSDDGATITANDFLTLLVTEMQNQDPTADTDPNEYIDQLVNVNSLEQLIQINQTLSTALPAPSSGTGGSSNLVHSISGAIGNAPSSPAAASTQPASAPPSAQALALTGAPAPVTAPVTSGNLSIPASNPAALRVARALGSSRLRR